MCNVPKALRSAVALPQPSPRSPRYICQCTSKILAPEHSPKELDHEAARHHRRPEPGHRLRPCPGQWPDGERRHRHGRARRCAREVEGQGRDDEAHQRQGRRVRPGRAVHRHARPQDRHRAGPPLQSLDRRQGLDRRAGRERQEVPARDHRAGGGQGQGLGRLPVQEPYQRQDRAEDHVHPADRDVVLEAGIYKK